MGQASLRKYLLAWDRKHVNYLKELYSKVSSEVFLNRLIAMLGEEEVVSHAVTWLLKHHLDQGGSLQSEHWDGLFAKAPDCHFWESRLHILQMLPLAPIAPEQASFLQAIVDNNLQSSNKFVRAAAFQASYDLTRVRPEGREDLKQLCLAREVHESPSVRVRIKRILKALENAPL